MRGSAASVTTPLLSIQNLVMKPDPFPCGLATGVFEPDFYDQLVADFPPMSLFKPMGVKGYSKFALSVRYNPEQYHQFLASRPHWAELMRYIKTGDFMASIFCRLGISVNDLFAARFEFSLMPAKNGFIRPHRDIKTKVISMVLPIIKPSEWDASWGGATEMLRQRDPGKDLVDYQAGWDDFDRVRAFPIGPNQASLFVKNNVSWHAVYPMTGPEGVWRQTLTLNIERATTA